MKHIDDLFRDGLTGRKPEVPGDMWSRINAARPAVPDGEALDQKFSDALRDREAPVPLGMWDRIVAARALPSRKGLYYAGAAALLLLLVAVAWYTFDQKTTPTDLATPSPIEAPLATTSPTNEGVTAGDHLFQSTSPTTSPTNESVDVAVGSRLLQSTFQTPTRTVAAPAPANNSEETGSNKTATGTETTREAVTGVETGNERLQPTQSSNTSTNNEALNAGAAEGAEAIFSASTAEPGEATTNTLSAPFFLPSALEELPANFSPDLSFKDRDYRIKPVDDGGFKRAPRHRMQTEMLFGAAYANQNLTAASDEDLALLATRENSEFPEVSFQVTLRQAYRLTDRITLRGGLTYVDIRNQFEYEELVNNELKLIRKNNHIRMLEVPLLAGLTLPGKRLRVSVNAGPVFNLTTAAQGEFLDPDFGEPRDLRENAGFRSYTGVGYMTSLTTSYVLGKKDPFVLVLEPFFKHYPGSFTRPDARIRESYWLAGLQLGVRKSL